MAPSRTRQLPADPSTLIIVAAFLTACLIVAGVLIALNVRQSFNEAGQRPKNSTGQSQRAGTSHASAAQDDGGNLEVAEPKKLHDKLQDAKEESAAGQAITSRRTSAKKRRGRARLRQRALRTPETIQEGEEENHDGDSDGDEQEDDALDLGRSAYDVARDQREKEREAQEHTEQERIRQEQERKAKLEQAELDKWKGQFTVDASGEDAHTMDHVQQLRQDICERLKQDKVVELQDLSLMFDTSFSEVVSTIQHLEKEGQLTGVLDDRGKYIYLSMEELKSLAALIESEGRISVTRLAQEATSLLRIVPNSTNTASAIGDDSFLDEILA